MDLQSKQFQKGLSLTSSFEDEGERRNPETGHWRHNSPWKCCHVCIALSGCCPIVVTVALGEPGAAVQASTESAVETGDEMSGPFSVLVNKWMVSSSQGGGHLSSPSWSINPCLHSCVCPLSPSSKLPPSLLKHKILAACFHLSLCGSSADFRVACSQCLLLSSGLVFQLYLCHYYLHLNLNQAFGSLVHGHMHNHPLLHVAIFTTSVRS